MYTVVWAGVSSLGATTLAPGSLSHRNQTAFALNAHKSKALPSPVETKCPLICLFSNKQTLIWDSNAFSIQTCETMENLLYQRENQLTHQIVFSFVCEQTSHFVRDAVTQTAQWQPVIIKSNVTWGRQKHQTEITLFLPAVDLRWDEGSLKHRPKGH